MISLAIFAPFSVVDDLRLLAQSLKPSEVYKKLSSSVGYVKSPRIHIEPENRLDVFIDDENATITPLHCETIADAVRVNIGEDVRVEARGITNIKGITDINNLPSKNELLKAKRQKRIHFFPMLCLR